MAPPLMNWVSGWLGARWRRRARGRGGRGVYAGRAAGAGAGGLERPAHRGRDRGDAPRPRLGRMRSQLLSKYAGTEHMVISVVSVLAVNF